MLLKDFVRLSDKGNMPFTDIECSAAEKANRRVNRLVKIAAEFESFAIGWDDFKVMDRLFEIGRFVAFHLVVPIDERRQLAGEARAILKAAAGIGRLDRAISRDLVDLAAQQPEFKGRGGNRRKGRHSVKAHVARMAVRLYLDASERPGFSPQGPLVRFVGDVSEAFGFERPSSNTVEKRWREIMKEITGIGSFGEAHRAWKEAPVRRFRLSDFYN
jgi:hypothetical protein